MRAHDRDIDIHSKDSVADDVDVAVGLDKATILPPDLQIFENQHDDSLVRSVVQLMVVNEELGQKLKTTEQLEKVTLDVAALVKGLNSSLEANMETLRSSLKDAEDKAYNEGFEKAESVMAEQIPVIEGFYFKKGWDTALVEAKVPTDFELLSMNDVTVPSSLGRNLPPTEVPVANTPVVVSFTVLIDDSTVDPIDPSDVL
ncbi:unnamed protein product [Ilex paraguariensis]|uniref:Uncharacterized protein n=1 Tax=Ilex paraguariensis TaxID=185542 RepID=A0ABC8U3J1_9AQUA